MRIAVGGILASAALGFLAGLAFQTASFREWLRQALLVRLTQRLAGELSVGSVEGDLFKTIVLRDLRLRADGRRVLAARRIEARYDLASLVTRGVLAVEELRVDGCALTLTEDARGWNIARLWRGMSANEDNALRVALDRVVINDGALRIVGTDISSRLSDVSLTGSVEIASRGQLFNVDRSSFTLRGRAIRVEELSGSLHHAVDGTLTVEVERLRTPGSFLTGSAGLSGGETPRYHVRARAAQLAAGELQRLLDVPVPSPDLAGRLQARGPAEALQVGLRLTSGAGKARVAGTLDLAGEPKGYDIKGTIARLDLARLVGRGLPPTKLSGTLSAAVRGGELRAASGRFSLALRGSGVAGKALPEVALEGSLATGTVVVDARAGGGGERAQVHATVDVPSEGYDLDLALRDVDPGGWLERSELTGRVSGTLRCSGFGFRPLVTRGEAHLTLAPSRLGGVKIDSGRAELRADEGRVTIEALALASAAATVAASATLTLATRDGALVAAETAGHARYQVRVRDLQPLAALAGVTMARGAGTIRGTAGGRLGDLDLDANVRGEGVAYDSFRARVIEATMTGRNLGSGQASVEGHARATGAQAYGRPLESVRVAGSWERRDSGVAAARVEVDVREDERRAHSVVATIAGAPKETRVAVQSGYLTIGGRRWQVEGAPVVVLRDDATRIEGLVLTAARGRVTVDGGIRRPGPIDLRLAISGLDLADVGGILGTRLNGNADAKVRLTGSLAAPALEGEITVHDPKVEEIRYRSFAARARLRDGTGSVDVRLEQEEGRDLTLAAALPVRFTLAPPSLEPRGQLAGELRARRIDLAFVDPLVPQLSLVGGTLAGDLSLGGTLGAPEATGVITLSGGRAFIVPLGIPYDPIDLALRLDGSMLTIDRLRIASGRGVLEGGGTIGGAARGPEIGARLRLQTFPLFATDLGRASASGELWVSGSTAAPVVEGSLATDELLIQIPETLPSKEHPPDPTIVVVGTAAPPPSPVAVAETAPSLFSVPGVYAHAAIHVQVSVARDAWIRRSDANIELKGLLTASKKPGDTLRLAGEIESVRGWYAFMGSKFDLDEGRLVFTDAEPSPRLDIVAKRRAGEYTVRALVQGTIEKPTLVLESEPSLDQADILSLIVFGHRAGQLSDAESRGLQDSAISLAANYVAPQLRRSVADALGVDDLTFETDVEGTTDERVSIGKYIAPDIFVSLAHRFGVRTAEELRVEYAITPNWSLETSADTLGRSGVDVFWKLRY